MHRLDGKVAVITGASRGLGKAIAEIFAREGARVVLSARSAEDIAQNAAALAAQGLEAAAFRCDVSDASQVEALARFAVESFGGFDIWVNNAGVPGPYGATLDIARHDFLDVLQTNLFGTYHGSMAAMRHFLARGSGTLINILGAGDRKPAPNQNPYGSSKAWIRVFTLALAAEYRDSDVGVHALQPGLMDTDLLSHIVTYEAYEKRLRAFMPFLIQAAGKKPELAARRALWLACPATDGRTGLEVRAGSSIAVLYGFLGAALRRLFRLPVRRVELDLKIIPSAFEPLKPESKP